jgi:superfamily II DNA or RNA helicase
MPSVSQAIVVSSVESESSSTGPGTVGLKLFTAEFSYKDRPWAALKKTSRILAKYTASHHEDPERDENLTLLENYSWKPLKTFASFIDPAVLDKANLVLMTESENIAHLAMDIYFKMIPLLREKGWQIEIDESFPFRPVEQEGEWYAELGGGTPTGPTDWFDLEMGLMIEGRRVNILPMLVRMLRQDSGRLQVESAIKDQDAAPIYVPMDNGQLLPVPADKVRYIAQTLIELYDTDALTDEGKLRLSAWQSTQLVEIEAAMRAAQMRWFGDDQARVLGAKLRDFTSIEQVEVPQSLQCSLRGYQIQGLSWLQFLRTHNLNGILADDMGLGKTVQTLGHILIEKESGRLDRPVLVIAPTSLMTNWRTEAAKYAPSLKVLVLHGNERKDLFHEITQHDLVLTTYPLLSRDKDNLLRHEYHLVVLDEAQVIKNPNTMAHRIVQQISARHRLCLTGTPMENHLGELWSLFYFLMPGFLGDQKKFNRLFRIPIEKEADEDRRLLLARRVKPFMLRRTKQQVVSELPPKTEIIQSIELLPQQRTLYETVRLTMHERVQQEIVEKGLNRSHIVILDALLKLRQICCDPRLLKLDAARHVMESAKMQFLMDTLPEMIQEKRQILLFSQFTSMLALIEEELQRQGIAYAKLTGQTKDRASEIEAFQSGRVSVFLISLKAGGTGLNLTAADTVIHFDPWWNPAVENQATDRAYRIGQDKPVFVYKLMTVGTVEEKIMAMQQRKSTLLTGILNSQNDSSESLFSAEDLEALFEPLG